MLGSARQVKVDKENTTIVEGAGEQRGNRGQSAAPSRRRLRKPPSDYDREKLQERLAKLAGGVAVINVGAATEVEMKEKKLRIEDALSGYAALLWKRALFPAAALHCLSVAPAVKRSCWRRLPAMTRPVLHIVLRAMEEPMRQIAVNAGLEGSVIVA